jgi:Integrase core domain
VSPHRIPKLSAIIKPATLFKFHRALVHRKYRLLFSFRREYFDQVFFWNAADLARKLNDYKIYYNAHRVHRSLGGSTPTLRAGASSAVPVLLDHHAWRPHCRGLLQTPIAA